MVDAGYLRVGAVLVQEDHHGVQHPIAYFSQKFNRSQQNYSEKYALALILALQHLDVYLSAAQHSTLVLRIIIL